MFELTAKANKEFEIKMYGTIAQWAKVNADDFEKSMSDAIAKGATVVTLTTHCPGGSVFEGMAMATNIKLAQAKGIKVIQRVDGLSASMSSLIGAACDEVHVAPFTRIMIHEGQWSAAGNVAKLREAANELERTNKDIAQLYADRINRTKPLLKRDTKWVLENWMAEGKDTWFSADEAIKHGLADKKISAVVKAPALENENVELTWTEMAAHLDKQFDKNEKPKMDREQLIKELGLKAEATDAEILAAITNLKAQKKADEKKDEGKKEGKKEEPAKNNEAAMDVIMIVAKDRGCSDDLIEKIKKVAGTDVKLALELLPEKKKDEEKTPSLNDLIQALKGDAKGGTPDRKSWDFKDWQKNDPNGLLAMAQKTPGEYAKLFETAFGYKPSEDEIKKLAK